MKDDASKKNLLIGLVIIVVVIAGVIWLSSAFLGVVWSALKALWGVIISIDPKLAAGIVIAVATVFGTVYSATITVVKGKREDRLLSIEAHFREIKTEIYNTFLVELFKVFAGKGKDMDAETLMAGIQDWNQKAILWAGPNALQSYIRWIEHLRSGKVDAESLFLMGEFVLSLREDVGLSNEGIDRKTIAFVILRNPGLIIEMAEKNPNVSLMEVAIEEEKQGLL